VSAHRIKEATMTTIGDGPESHIRCRLWASEYVRVPANCSGRCVRALPSGWNTDSAGGLRKEVAQTKDIPRRFAESGGKRPRKSASGFANSGNRGHDAEPASVKFEGQPLVPRVRERQMTRAPARMEKISEALTRRAEPVLHSGIGGGDPGAEALPVSPFIQACVRSAPNWDGDSEIHIAEVARRSRSRERCCRSPPPIGKRQARSTRRRMNGQHWHSGHATIRMTIPAQSPVSRRDIR